LEPLAYQSLLDVSKTILQHQDLAGLFHDLAAKLRLVLHFDYLNLILHDPQRNIMRLHILEFGAGEPLEAPQIELPPEESPSGWVFLHQEPLVIPDVRRDTRWPQIMDLLIRNKVLTSCWLPLTTAQHRLGALGFGFRSAFPIETQLDFMQQVAAQVAVAVDNTLNYEKAEKYRQQVARERDRLQILLEITNALVSELGIRELFPTISTCLRRAVPHEYASLALCIPGTNELKIHALVFDGDPDIFHEGATAAMDETPAGQAVETRRPVILDEAALDRFSSPLAPRLKEAGLKSACCIPLITRRRVLGTLNVGSTRENAFSTSDVDFLSQVAGQAAIAIENATTYQEIGQLRDQLAEEKLYLQDEIRTERNFGEIVGDSPPFRHILNQVETVAPTDASVLILGETGTGKELIARAIHDLSARRDRTFVKLNCAAIPTGLLESELFGHEKGAFTGAIAQKAGRFELANRGTLFLDEIGDIPLELQPKLLRALQEHEFERLGGTHTIKVDVRVVAATNRDLAQMIGERQFRTDLYYRLSVFPLSVPPLRDRPEDIPKLVRYFTQKYSRRMNRHIATIPQETMEALVHYAWPGNVRELENRLKRAVIMADGKLVTAEDLDLAAPAGESLPVNLKAARETADRCVIRKALAQTDGNISGAAKLLGISRPTLYDLLKQYGLQA
jgi:formate hydrogenlyase transcriptional activator